MTDEYICPVYKSHDRKQRRWAWVQGADGEWFAVVDCMQCDPPQRIAEIASPELYADLLPPKPPAIRPMLPPVEPTP